jgi:glycosyltransferase involved in cell wall biosynthesis
MLNTVSFVLGALWAAIFSPRHALLVAVTNPPLLPWLVAFLNVMRGQRYILLIHDVYPEIAVELGALPPHSWITRLWKKLNGFAYRRAERVVVLGRDMQSLLTGQLPVAKHERLRLIPNWADAQEIYPIQRDAHPAFEELKALDRFVVQYSGNIGRFHEIETLIGAANQALPNSYLFLFIGTGAQRSLIERAQAKLGGERIALWEFQPRERLGYSLTACDVGVVTLRAGLSGMAVPSKLYGILAAGKPVLVIGPDDCEAARVVREAECGLVVAPGDVAGVLNALERLRTDSALCRAMGDRARRLFEERYDLPIVVAQWRELLEEL